jgi:hypothetical protein
MEHFATAGGKGRSCLTSASYPCPKVKIFYLLKAAVPVRRRPGIERSAGNRAAVAFSAICKQHKLKMVSIALPKSSLLIEGGRILSPGGPAPTISPNTILQSDCYRIQNISA